MVATGTLLLLVRNSIINRDILTDSFYLYPHVLTDNIEIAAKARPQISRVMGWD